MKISSNAKPKGKTGSEQTQISWNLLRGLYLWHNSRHNRVIWLWITFSGVRIPHLALVYHSDFLTKLFAYDDACHLKRFVSGMHKTASEKFIPSLKNVVDKMHFKIMLTNCVVEFYNLNTKACEQTFKFVSKFKHATNHMTYASYGLFHFKMCNMYNEDTLLRVTNVWDVRLL